MVSNLTSTNGMACKGWLLENEKQANYVEQKAEEACKGCSWPMPKVQYLLIIFGFWITNTLITR